MERLPCFCSYHFSTLLTPVDGRVFNDLRLYMTFQLIPCLAIPLMTVLLPPKYTHSRFWLLATGCSSLLRLSLLENPLSSDIPDSL
ncbi:hypothetical protein F2Q68_00006445 [Brassica cretica]|uniref:Uncharacterized protein n=1 Tax=Brassica cretica TaxID=69181 RepID=A0A8S9J3M7_BRACR|nr:hypothetical protein F2Q68_00006445 [Brassica cretica]